MCTFFPGKFHLFRFFLWFFLWFFLDFFWFFYSCQKALPEASPVLQSVFMHRGQVLDYVRGIYRFWATPGTSPNTLPAPAAPADVQRWQWAPKGETRKISKILRIRGGVSEVVPSVAPGPVDTAATVQDLPTMHKNTLGVRGGLWGSFLARIKNQENHKKP